MNDTLPIRLPVLSAPPERTAGPVRARRAFAARAAAVLAVAAVLALGLVGWAAGLRVFVVESPSMGEAAPVGTLLIGSAGAPVSVGDLITFRPPDSGATPYTHRVVAITRAGYRTKGDINGTADPWVVAPSMVISRVTAVVPAAGWLVRGAPLLVGALVVAQAAGLLLRSPTTRWSVRVVALALGVGALSWMYKPFAGWTLLQSVARADGMHATIVSTALLPVRLVARGGGHLDLHAGEVGRIVLPRSAHGQVTLTTQLALDPLGWGLVVIGCLLPVIVVLAIGVPVQLDQEFDGAQV